MGREYVEHINGVKLVIVEIPAGSFCMGLHFNRYPTFSTVVANTIPKRQVRVQSFWMGKYEVTQAQWRAVMGTNPSSVVGDNLPVHQVSWNDAVEFCRRLSQVTGREYRLPTEAEWEYAARAGTTTDFAFGSSISSTQANFEDSPTADPFFGRWSPKKPTPVGNFPPNKFGLYDMHGNVWEWCQDSYHHDYEGAPTDGSAWESGGEQNKRVLRGGSSKTISYYLHSASRFRDDPGRRSEDYGLRVVLKSLLR